MNTCKNHMDDGGDTLVIGGKLVVEDGAEVEGLDTGGSDVTWATLSGKPATFPPTIGATATTAKAGNYAPTTAEVSNVLKTKTQIAALTAIADPATAEASAIATVVNAIIAALKA